MDFIRKEYYKALKYSNKVYILTANWLMKIISINIIIKLQFQYKCYECKYETNLTND